jgi:hypothetical protein
MALQRLLILIGSIGIGIGSFLPWRWFPFGLSVRAFREYGWLTAIFSLATALIALMAGPLERPVTQRKSVLAVRVMCILSTLIVLHVIHESVTLRDRLGPDIGAGIVIGSAILAVVASFMRESITVADQPASEPAFHPASESPVSQKPQQPVRTQPQTRSQPQPSGFILNRETIHLVPETWTAPCPSCKTSLVLHRSLLRIDVTCGHCGSIFEVTWP